MKNYSKILPKACFVRGGTTATNTSSLQSNTNVEVKVVSKILLCISPVFQNFVFRVADFLVSLLIPVNSLLDFHLVKYQMLLTPSIFLKFTYTCT